jgi:putative tryptophan/tyrosine transport system substrate-binding protein
MKRMEFLGLATAMVWPVAAHWQQPRKFTRLGFLSPASASNRDVFVEAFRAGLRELGYVEGRDIVIEYRWAEGNYDRLPLLATELVQLRVDVLVTHSTPGVLAAKEATTTIPIVMIISGDAVGSGLVGSLKQPGGNAIGQSFFIPDLSAKRLELLKEMFPQIRSVVVLFNSNNPMTRGFSWQWPSWPGHSPWRSNSCRFDHRPNSQACFPKWLANTLLL